MGVYRFGEFDLNEESRGLRLGGVELETQPLVFDFLAMLLRHQDRALSKDELLSALWPGVTVTEASLQRVASLARSILRQGGMEKALRNLPRFGYRLCRDTPVVSEASDPGTVCSPAERAKPASAVLTGRAAVAARKWEEAVSAFAQADADDALLITDLEDWALALECCGRASAGIPLLTRAVAGYSMAGHALNAAMPAISLARIHKERNEFDVANGWHKRARELIGTNLDTREYGLWCWLGSILHAAEPARALALAEEACAVGKKLEDPAVESLGVMFRGFFKLCAGETEAGIEDQNLAAALGLSSDVDPVVGTTLYCNLLWACRNAGDWARADQWTLGYESYCRSSGLDDVSGWCRLHRAEVLGIHGTLKEAETRVVTALHQLTEEAPWSRGDALRVLGDVRRLMGDFAGAEEAYRGSHAAGWDPQPGFALLLLEQGEEEAAYHGLERSLTGTGWPTLQRRGLMLATLAKVAARAKRPERAKQIIEELDSQPRRWPMPSIRALIAEAKAELYTQESRKDDAVRELQMACSLWNQINSMINCAEARLSMAGLLMQMGDEGGARLELSTAESFARKVDSERLLRRCAALRERLGARVLTS